MLNASKLLVSFYLCKLCPTPTSPYAYHMLLNRNKTAQGLYTACPADSSSGVNWLMPRKQYSSLSEPLSEYCRSTLKASQSIVRASSVLLWGMKEPGQQKRHCVRQRYKTENVFGPAPSLPVRRTASLSDYHSRAFEHSSEQPSSSACTQAQSLSAECVTTPEPSQEKPSLSFKCS